MRSTYGAFKKMAINLRKKGKTYSEIKRALGKNIPKSTLSLWCKNIVLSKTLSARIETIISNNAKKGRLVKTIRHREYLKSVFKKTIRLRDVLQNEDVAKIALAILYLGEGSKTRKSSLMFGNSDPQIVKLFFKLIRYCYKIDETKFRCTVQCRADQNTKFLNSFWSNITKIPLKQFYKPRIDPRSVGKKSKKLDYKGVCRVDYFSADVYNDLKIAGEVLTN